MLDREQLQWFREKLRDWAASHRRDFPWRRTGDPYAVLVAEVMLQQTFARKVVPVYTEFMKRYPSPYVLAGVDVAEVERLIRPLGLQSRARTLAAMARSLVERHGGEVPSTEAELLALAGVGYYTAGAVRSFAFHQRAAIPDANVIRVLRRFFGLGAPDARPPSSIALDLRRAALEVVPEDDPRAFNYSILDFAAAHCTHYNPGCPSCPLAAMCASREFFLRQAEARSAKRALKRGPKQRQSRHAAEAERARARTGVPYLKGIGSWAPGRSLVREAAAGEDGRAPSLPTSDLVIGAEYSRRQIHAALGGSVQEYLPHKDGVVVCGCFTLEQSPRAPDVVLSPGGPKIRCWAEVFLRQATPVPIFIKQGRNRWRYVGDYAARDVVTDVAEAQRIGMLEGRQGIRLVLYLRKAAP